MSKGASKRNGETKNSHTIGKQNAHQISSEAEKFDNINNKGASTSTSNAIMVKFQKPTVKFPYSEMELSRKNIPNYFRPGSNNV